MPWTAFQRYVPSQEVPLPTLTANVTLHLYTLLKILTVELPETAIRGPISRHGPED